AVLAAADPPVDLLLTDVVMPGMSGMDLARRARDRIPDLPVLMMSGHTAGVIADDAPLPQRTALLRKPFTAAALLRPLDELLGHVDEQPSHVDEQNSLAEGDGEAAPSEA